MTTAPSPVAASMHTDPLYVLDPDTRDVWEDGVNDGQTPNWYDVARVAAATITNPTDAWTPIVDLLPVRPTGSLWWITTPEGFAVSPQADLRPGASMDVEVWVEA